MSVCNNVISFGIAHVRVLCTFFSSTELIDMHVSIYKHIDMKQIHVVLRGIRHRNDFTIFLFPLIYFRS